MKIDAEAVYAAVRAIPPGTVLTYGGLAEKVGLTSGHARAVGRVLAARPGTDDWRTLPPEEHDIPWWRVVKKNGSLRPEGDEEHEEGVAWARRALINEGVELTADGRVASLASGARRSGSGSSGSRSKPIREPSPCWKHEKIQYSCRDCVPAQ